MDIKVSLDKGICFIKVHWKQIWTVLLFVAGVRYISINYNNIATNPNFMSIMIVLVTFTIGILPIATEVNFFGFSIKKDIIKTKEELEDKIYNLKLQMIDIKTNNTITTNLYSGPLPNKDDINEMKKEASIGSEDSESNNTKDLTEEEKAVILFKSRWGIERRVNRIFYKAYLPMAKYVLPNKIETLHKIKLIDRNQLDLINNILKICNRGIHGEIIDNYYIGFVTDSTPVINKFLDEIELPPDRNNNLDMEKIECFRCGYSGYVDSGNRCPQCGAYVDD